MKLECSSCGQYIWWDEKVRDYVGRNLGWNSRTVITTTMCDEYYNGHHTISDKKEDRPLADCEYCKASIFCLDGIWYRTYYGMGYESSKCMSNPDSTKYHRPKKEDQPVPNNTSPTWEEVDKILTSKAIVGGASTRWIVETRDSLRPLWNTPENASVGQVRISPHGNKYVKLSVPYGDQPASKVWLAISNSPSATVLYHDDVRDFRIAGNLPE